jgi:hypothetical protein
MKRTLIYRATDGDYRVDVTVKINQIQQDGFRVSKYSDFVNVIYSLEEKFLDALRAKFYDRNIKIIN